MPHLAVERSMVGSLGIARQSYSETRCWRNAEIGLFGLAYFPPRCRQLSVDLVWAGTLGAGLGARDLPLGQHYLGDHRPTNHFPLAVRYNMNWEFPGSNERRRQHEKREANAAP